jgi:3'(2'), 5'-bisphosphate nucleotidase
MTTSPSDRQALLAILEVLAVAAGKEILDVRARHFDITQKSDGSPVTEADQRAEKLIVSGLLKHFPESIIVAEEMIASGDMPPALGRGFFLVDALDGTREFCAGREEFTVNIGLIEDGAPIAGVVHAPSLGSIYSGEHDGRGKGSASRCKVLKYGHLSGRKSINVRPCADPQTILATRSHMTPETKSFLDNRPEADLKSIGSSLKFCLLAAGEADLYPRFGTTMEWDTAAGDAILRAAGGRTETEDGKPLTYGKRGQAGMADFQNPFFVSRGV